MKLKFGRQFGKRGQWILPPVLGSITIWIVFSVFESPVAQIVSKLGVAALFVVLVLLLLDIRQKLWALKLQSRAIDKRVSALVLKHNSAGTRPQEPVQTDPNSDKLRRNSELDAMAVKLENEIRSGFRSLGHNKSTDEAVLRLEAYARHVISVTSVTVNRDRNRNELHADGSVSIEDGR